MLVCCEGVAADVWVWWRWHIYLITSWVQKLNNGNVLEKVGADNETNSGVVEGDKGADLQHFFASDE